MRGEEPSLRQHSSGLLQDSTRPMIRSSACPLITGGADMRLADKVFVITGAASGIGLASAKLFAREGARLMLGDLDAASGERAVAEVEAASGQAAFAQTDVTSAADVQ